MLTSHFDKANNPVPQGLPLVAPDREVKKQGVALGVECSHPSVTASPGHFLSVGRGPSTLLDCSLPLPAPSHSYVSSWITQDLPTVTVLVTCRKHCHLQIRCKVSFSYISSKRKKKKDFHCRHCSQWLQSAFRARLRPHSRTTQQRCTQSCPRL